MKYINNISNIDFNKIPIDVYWNNGDQKENLMHKIHSYPAKFPSFITSKAVELAESRGIKVNVIADMFCGCGTTAYEAARIGKNFWGCDINPVATLIAQTKSFKYNENILDKYFKKILKSFASIKLKTNQINNLNPRLFYWYKHSELKNLQKLKIAIEENISHDSQYYKFFLCAFSNILKPTSMWLTKSIKPQYDPNKIPANVIEAFKSQYNFMIKANESNDIMSNTIRDIVNDNFLEINIDKQFADLIVSSAPYVTSYEYADLHQLSTVWLGYTDDYKSLREGSIGSLYHQSDYNMDYNNLNSSGKSIISELYNVDKRKAKSAAKYFIDIQIAITKAFSLLNNNSLALFVIGNTEYKNAKINNALHLAESMLMAGFSDIEISKRKISKKILTPYRDTKGRFTTDSNSRKVYSEEFILIGRKYNGN
ncbi:MAG: DNA methyltransferase [Ignavibacteriaceae bacterium]